jgi:hypothetical protein
MSMIGGILGLIGGRRARRRLVQSACLVLVIGPSLQGATLTADSVSREDVQKAVDAAADGDIVRLPAGTATWTASVRVADKFITIEGAGIGRTTIVGGEYAPSSTRPTH